MPRVTTLILFTIPLLALVSHPSQSQTPEPTSDPFVVNTTVEGFQAAPTIAGNGDGEFVVAWSSRSTAEYIYSLLAQRLLADGTLLGGEILVDSAATVAHFRPQVGMAADGSFVVSWSQTDTGQAGSEVKVRRYDGTGSPFGPEFTANTFSTDNQFASQIAVLPDGAFVVAWTSNGGDGDIMARRFDSVGLPETSPIQVRPPSGEHRAPDIAADGLGRFVVTWEFDDGLTRIVEARRFTSNGTPQDDAFQVSTPVGYSQSGPAIGRNASGRFVITWEEYLGQFDGETDIFARRFGGTGNPLGDAFQVNVLTASYQVQPNVAVDDEGAFQVVWFDDAGGSINRDIVGQRFNANGTRDGDTWVASIDPARGASIPAGVTPSARGRFVTVWNDDDFSSEILARAYKVATVFDDGFESGDVSAWSASAP